MSDYTGPGFTTSRTGRPEGRPFTLKRSDGREATFYLARNQSVGKVGPDTGCSACGRVMDEGEVARHTAPTWPPSPMDNTYVCAPCLFPPDPAPAVPLEQRVADPGQDRARIALLEARVAALEARLG